MESKPLLYGLIGFFLGGLIVSIAATTFEKPAATHGSSQASSQMTMDEMTSSLRTKSGDDYDKTFINHMIEHHQSAVEMARLSAERAKHDEIKQLSKDIIAAQESEINQMRQWQRDWGYEAGHDGAAH